MTDEKPNPTNKPTVQRNINTAHILLEMYSEMIGADPVATNEKMLLESMLSDLFVSFAPMEPVLVAEDVHENNAEKYAEVKAVRGWDGWHDYNTWNVVHHINTSEKRLARWRMYAFMYALQYGEPFTVSRTASTLADMYPKGETNDGVCVLDACLRNLTEAWNRIFKQDYLAEMKQ